MTEDNANNIVQVPIVTSITIAALGRGRWALAPSNQTGCVNGFEFAQQQYYKYRQ